jgi:hypothetical protein
MGILVLLLIVCTYGTTLAATANIERSAILRPGFMAGDSNNETDFFTDLFIPVAGSENSIIFLNPNLRADDKSSSEQNIGIGARLLIDESLILGVNVYYDAMRSRHNNQFQQWGVGFEALSKWVDLRGNYYKPFGETEYRVEDLDSYEFASSSIILNKGSEEAHDGAELEVGVLVPYISNFMETRVFAGGYWFGLNDREDRINGEKFRIEIRPLDFISVNIETRHDDIRGTDTFGGAYIEVPFDLGELFALRNPFKTSREVFSHGTRPLADRLTDKVVRDRHIVTHDHDREGGEKFADLIYVNADNAGGGSGTLDNPYTDLASVTGNTRYLDGVWVYVFSTDDVADTHYVNLTLPDNLILWGQGYGFNGLGGDGPMPILDGDRGRVITLGENNEVMGLQIENGYYGIYADNVSTLNIHDNLIQYNRRHGVYVTHNDWSDGVSDETHIYTFTNNSILNNRYDGVAINTYVGVTEGISNLDINTTFTGNTISGNDSGINIYTYLDAKEITNVNLSNTFTDNVIENNWDYGVSLFQHMAAYRSTRSGGGTGAALSGSTIDNRFTNNTITGSDYDGVYVLNVMGVRTRGSVTPLDTLTATLENSAISNTFTNNEIFGNAAGYGDVYGVSLNNYLGSSLSASNMTVNGDASSNITNTSISNELTNNSLGGAYMENSVSTSANLYNTTINGDVAVEVDALEISNTVKNNSLYNTEGYGLELKSREYKFLSASSTSMGNLTLDTNLTTVTNTLTGNDTTGSVIEPFALDSILNDARTTLTDAVVSSNTTDTVGSSVVNDLSNNTGNVE